MDELKKMIDDFKGKIPTLSGTDREALAGLLSSTLSDLNESNSSNSTQVNKIVFSQNSVDMPQSISGNILSAYNSTIQSVSSSFKTISKENSLHFSTQTLINTADHDSGSKCMNIFSSSDSISQFPNCSSDCNNQDDETIHVRRSSRKRKCAKPTKLNVNSYCDNPLLNCNECSSHFDNLGSIITHLRKEHSQMELSCIFCKGVFFNPGTFRLHECLNSDQKYFINRKCALCQKSFNSKFSFSKHKRVMHNDQEQSYKCQLCKEIFSQKNKLWHHVKQNHAATMKTCHECCQMVKCVDTLMEHYASAHNLPVGCRLCELGFKSNSVLKNHLLKTHKRQCVLCEINMSSIRELDKHYLTKHNLRLGFTSETKHKTKKIKHSLVDMESILDNQTTTASNLTEAGGKDFSAISKSETNLKILINKCSRRRHSDRQASSQSNLHSQKKSSNTICYICGRSYSSVHTLKRHMLTHNNEYPFKCSYCDFKTVEKANLDQHLARHFEFKQFQCRICQKSFVEKRALTDHILFKHNTQKNYICPICGKAFKTAGVLSRHKKIHTPDKLYECICGISFNRLSNLRRHYMVVHRKNNQATVIPRYRSLKKFIEPTGNSDDHNESLPTLDEELEQEVVNGTQVISLTRGNMMSHGNTQQLETTGAPESQNQPILMTHSNVTPPCSSSCLNANSQVSVMMNHGDPSLYHHGGHASSSTNKNLDHLWRPMVDGLESTSASSTSYNSAVDSRLLPSHDDVIWSGNHYNDTFGCLIEPSSHHHSLQNSLLSGTDNVLLPHCQPTIGASVSHPVDTISSSCLMSNDSLLSGLLPQADLQSIFLPSSASTNHLSISSSTVLPSLCFTSQSSHQNYANQQCSDFSVGYLIGSNPAPVPHASNNFSIR